MRAWAHIGLIPQDSTVQAQREAAMARGVLLKAGVQVPLHGSGGDVQGEVGVLLHQAERVRTSLEARGMAHLTTLVKLGVSPEFEVEEARRTG